MQVKWFVVLVVLVIHIIRVIFLNEIVKHCKRTFRHRLAFSYVGLTYTTSPNAYIAFLNSLAALATSAYRAMMIVTCTFASFVLGYIPVVGGAVGTIFFCYGMKIT